MKNNPEEVKNHLMWMVGCPPEVTQEWIFIVLQQFLEDNGLDIDKIQALVPVISDQEVLRGEKTPEDPLAQAFLDSLVDYLKTMKESEARG